MRRLYADMLWRRLRAGDWRFPFRAARGAWAAWRREERPLLGTLIVTYRCDLVCSMCDLPRRGNRKAELSTQEFFGVLDGMQDLGVLGVGITGGEPLLRPDLLDIIRHGTRRGLLMHVNTNGTLITTEMAHAFAEAGVASINLSLDGPTAEIHDKRRGRVGSFDNVMRAAARLISVPKRPYRVAITCALGADNAQDAEAVLDRARDLGVDRVGFIPVHDFPANRVTPLDANAARIVRDLVARRMTDPLLDNSKQYLELFGRAYQGKPNPLPCSAPRHSVVVDCFGAVFPCVPLNAARDEVGRGDVREVWRSKTYRDARAALKQCRACYWNCHTEMNIALKKVGV